MIVPPRRMATLVSLIPREEIKIHAGFKVSEARDGIYSDVTFSRMTR
jgi:hypothetical protein